MKLLLVETTAYAPVSPLFKEACEAKAQADASFDWRLMDESAYSWPWTFEYNVLSRSAQYKPDVVLFVKGTLATKECLQRLKSYAGKLVCFQTDDPWNPAACHARIVHAIPMYDLYATCKTAIMEDLTTAGSKTVIYVPCGYKPEIHHMNDRLPSYYTDPFACDVSVIGGADEERIGIVKNLITAMPDLNLKLYGGYWNREPALSKYAHGHVYGWQYREAIRNAKVVLNILRSANRDQHNMRTFEIPACGGVQLTERTPEHEELLGKSHMFTTKDDLIDDVAGLLENFEDWERRKIVGGGPMKDCTWNVRLDQMLKAL